MLRNITLGKVWKIALIAQEWQSTSQFRFPIAQPAKNLGLEQLRIRSTTMLSPDTSKLKLRLGCKFGSSWIIENKLIPVSIHVAMLASPCKDSGLSIDDRTIVMFLESDCHSIKKFT